MKQTLFIGIYEGIVAWAKQDKTLRRVGCTKIRKPNLLDLRRARFYV